jgi:hypothetical protein
MKKKMQNILPYITAGLGVLLAVSVGFNIYFAVKPSGDSNPNSYVVNPDYEKQAEQQTKNAQAYIKGWSYWFRDYGMRGSGTGAYYAQQYSQGYEYGKEYEDALTAFITGYYDGYIYVNNNYMGKNVKEAVADCKADSGCVERFTDAYNQYYNEN